MKAIMHALEVQQLRKTYANGVEALKGVELCVQEGDFFGLLGPNGAGKTTLIGIISSLVNKTSGSVRVFGADLDTQREQVKSTIGIVPQEFNFNLFETVLNIVLTQAGFYGLPRKLAMCRAEEYLKRMELWGKRHSRARELSGGMRRRLMIARALMHEPRLLILDEPTAGVDLSIRRDMWQYLREINDRGTTIILTTHYLEEAERLCKNIAIIDQGDIIRNTGVEELLSTLTIETFELFSTIAHPQPVMLDHFTVRKVSDFVLEVDVKADQSLNDLFAQLSVTGFVVSSMRNKANRLEELFLQLTQHPQASP